MLTGAVDDLMGVLGGVANTAPPVGGFSTDTGAVADAAAGSLLRAGLAVRAASQTHV